MDRVLRRLLGSPLDAPPLEGVAAWVRRHDAATEGLARGVLRALAAGALADRVGWAFASGYRAALERAVPTLEEGALACLCATEEAGAHPRAIHTSLEALPDGGWVLRGAKKWATLAPAAKILVVVAREGEGPDGRPRLRAVRIDARAPGVTVRPMPRTPFTPEIEHGAVQLDGVAVAAGDVLAGDAWEDLLRPFRTIEDVHVLAGVTGWLLGEAGRGAWPRGAREDLAALATTLGALGAADPSSPVTHVVLASVLRTARSVFEGAAARLGDAARAAWERDRALLEVAGSARARRAEVAWEKLSR